MHSHDAFDVIVIGAGFSGLAAATRLCEAGKRVCVLEARDRVGGRSMAAMLAGSVVDVGGQWVGAGHQRLAQLAAEAGAALRPQYTTGAKLIRSDGRLKRYTGQIPPVSLRALAEMSLAIWRLRQLQKRVPAHAPWQAADAAALDTLTLQAWKQRWLRSKGGSAIFDIATRAVLCTEPSQLSLLAFLHYLSSSGGFEYLTSSTDGGQAFTVQGGMHGLSQHLADALGSRVRLNTTVSALTEMGDQIEVRGEQYRLLARRVIVAMAPSLAGEIALHPALAHRQQLAARMPMGSVIKCLVAYRTPFWRARGLSGEFADLDAVLSPTFDASPADAGTGVLVGFIDGAVARRWSGNAPARRQAVIDSLVSAFGPEAAEPIDYVDHDWIADPLSRGCYVGIPTPGTLTALGPALRAPCGRIHWAGTETAERWYGYLEGALQAGERAAAEVITALR